MKRLATFVREHFKPIFLALLFANVIIINLLQENSELLISDASKLGIVSLELNTSPQNQTEIIRQWQKVHKRVWSLTVDPLDQGHYISGMDAARTQTKRDLIFIGLYSMLLLTLAWRLASERDARALLVCVAAIVLAAIFDVIEDFGIFAVLKDATTSPVRIFLPAFAKFACLGLAVFLLIVWVSRRKLWLVLLRQVSVFLVDGVHILVKFRIVAIGLILLFFALWLSDQGRDLLLVVNNNFGGPILFLVMVSLLALLNWHLPKFYTTSSTARLKTTGMSFSRFFTGGLPPNEPAQEDHRYTARLLGVLTFIIPAICILNALRLFHIPYLLDKVHPFFLGLFTIVFYHMAILEGWIEKIFRITSDGERNKAKQLGLEKRIFLFIGAIIVIVALIGLNTDADATFYLAYLSLDLFLLSFAFLVFVTLRTCLPGNRLGADRVNRYIILAAVAVSVIFLLLNFFTLPLGEALRIVAIPVLFIAVIFYTLVLSYLLLLGRRYRIRFITLLIIACFIISRSLSGPFHSVRYVADDQYPPVSAIPRLKDYAANWIRAHLSEIDSFNKSGRPYPVFFVNAYGGGIRAAAWTTLAISKLDSQLYKNSGIDFQHYVFSYSTASGGTIGASLLCATRFAKRSEAYKNFPAMEWSSWYKNDFLTPVLVGLLGRDLWYSSFGIWGAHDRAYLQEWTWEKTAMDKKVDYHLPFYSYWDTAYQTKYDIPLLFSNTYDIDGGLKGIVAPVDLDTLDFPGSVFVNKLIKNPKDRLKLSTGAFLSARFPVISPTGKVDEFHHFMDGGFKENSGAETSRQVMAVFARACDRFFKDSAKSKIRLQILCLPNSIDESDTLEKAKNVSEFTAPFTALMNNWIGNTKKADEVNRIDTSSFHNGYSVLGPTQHPINGFQPVLPLGWQISDYGLKEMMRSLDYQMDSIGRILKKIKP